MCGVAWRRDGSAVVAGRWLAVGREGSVLLVRGRGRGRMGLIVEEAAVNMVGCWKRLVSEGLLRCVNLYRKL